MFEPLENKSIKVVKREDVKSAVCWLKEKVLLGKFSKEDIKDAKIKMFMIKKIDKAFADVV